jgi:hypothetical protein
MFQCSFIIYSAMSSLSVLFICDKDKERFGEALDSLKAGRQPLTCLASSPGGELLLAGRPDRDKRCSRQLDNWIICFLGQDISTVACSVLLYRGPAVLDVSRGGNRPRRKQEV